MQILWKKCRFCSKMALSCDNCNYEKVFLVTESELRHQFLRIFLSHAAEVALIKTYAKSQDKIVAKVDNTLKYKAKKA
jgi:hypothetical protein